MGMSISKLFNGLWGVKEMGILMVGLDGAGKTTILYKLKLDKVINTIPTIGFNVETVKYKNISFTVWDVGGQNSIRTLWRNYFQNIQGIIYVVDSSDHDRIQEAHDELQHLLTEEELCEVPFLIFANKQDIPNAMCAAEIVDKLGLLTEKRNWYIQTTSAITGDGLYEGLEWFSQNINNINLKENASMPNEDDKKMDLSFSRFFKSLWVKKKITILLDGLDAGKTTILLKLRFGEFISTIPTIGFSEETIEYKNVSFTFIDTPPSSMVRQFRSHYFKQTQGVIYVVDSSDCDNIQEARDDILRLLIEDELRDVPFLIFANKQDLSNAMDVALVTEKLGFNTVQPNNHKWHIQASSAITGEGLYEGLDWLIQTIK